MNPLSVAVIGAGPAGLTAAYLHAKKGVAVTVLEADPEYVGGISRTVTYNGFHFDIGGHRFFSKSRAIEDLWTEILGDDLLTRPRSSRIHYAGQFFSYPLRAGETLRKLGVIESIRCVLSYAAARLRPIHPVVSFEEWVINHFGERLYRAFFKTYTEKVWGIPCREISADWASQRIRGLSLAKAVAAALWPSWGGRGVKSLITSFRYPREGPGMMWQRCADRVREWGGDIRLGQRVVGCSHDEETGEWTVRHQDRDGRIGQTRARHLISSAPLRQLARGLRPGLSGTALAAADSLKYRDFVTVALILKDRGAIPDNWVYIHDPEVRVGRVQNFKSWSPEMVPDVDLTCYGLEYFCQEGDGLWDSSDDELLAQAERELLRLGLAKPGDVLDGRVVRQPKAYPVYDADYAMHVATLRAELDERFPTLHLVGRNGMHKYNNQDHAMMTAMLSVENILAGRRVYDVWNVNQDAEYHEGSDSGSASGASGLRMVPTRRAMMAKVDSAGSR